MTFKNFVVNEETHKHNINKIDIFDFDDTLIYPPNATKAKDILARYNIRAQSESKEEVPMNWDDDHAYWYTEQSLMPPVVPNPCPCALLNQSVARHFYASARDPKKLTVLMTGRPPRLEEQVQRILDDFKLQPDRFYLMSEEEATLDSKVQHIAHLLDEFPHIQEIEMWDDRGAAKAKLTGDPKENHCKEFKRYFKKCKELREQEDNAWTLKFKVNEIPPRDNEAVFELKKRHPDYAKPLTDYGVVA